MSLRRLHTHFLLFLSLLACGCSASPAGLAVKVVGTAINDVDVAQRAKELVGQPPRAADEMFGSPNDTLTDVNSDRKYMIYPVEGDALGMYRYVVEVRKDLIVALTKAQQYSNPVSDEAKRQYYQEKVLGKSPAACEQSLELGRPLLTAQSKQTGQLIQLYDAGLIEIEGLTKPHYAVLKFAAQRCTEINLFEAVASTKAQPVGG